jgi:hypothetical protein
MLSLKFPETHHLPVPEDHESSPEAIVRAQEEAVLEVLDAWAAFGVVPDLKQLSDGVDLPLPVLERRLVGMLDRRQP